MKRRPAPELTRLRSRIARLDSDSIDRLYGLEPVWEPTAGSIEPVEIVSVRCPYCGERLESRVDLTADEPAYVEDCEVCCRPIEFAVEREQDGALRALGVRRLD